MTKLGHSRSIRFLIFFALILATISCSQKQQPPAAAPQSAPTQPLTIAQIARTYGLDQFGQVEAIRYTWNAQFPGVNVARSWVWEPKKDQVSYEGKDKDGKVVKVTYLRSQLNSQPDNVKTGIEPAFVNDNYWLLFPLHAYWDKSATVLIKARNRCHSAAARRTWSRGGRWLHARRRVGSLRQQR